MKKTILPLFLFFFQSGQAQEEPEFGLYFGNDFRSDTVTVFINGIEVARNIPLQTSMIDPKNLMIEQEARQLSVRPYGLPGLILSKIPLHPEKLSLDIQMNRHWRHFEFDLSQGNYLYAGYLYIRTGWSAIKLFYIYQDTFPPIMI